MRVRLTADTPEIRLKADSTKTCLAEARRREGG
jgi:hypothetical protein